MTPESVAEAADTYTDAENCIAYMTSRVGPYIRSGSQRTVGALLRQALGFVDHPENDREEADAGRRPARRCASPTRSAGPFWCRRRGWSASRTRRRRTRSGDQIHSTVLVGRACPPQRLAGRISAAAMGRRFFSTFTIS